ncbi:glycosyltransferase, MGT family protein [Calothrix sp. NIES-4071]|nr:glycosyltransferase, MGT family protein [Calothrix sp. NIES-4071]BAZ60041.1 glycosyltransferase, MGT family protein [Calothrix sp. NIES-4105]
MTHFGIICPSSTGHINTMFPLVKELQKRGNKITIFGTPSSQAKIESAGFGVRLIGEEEFSPERTAKFYAKLGELSGIAATRHTISGIAKRAEVNLRDAPAAAKEASIEAFLVDQICFEGGTIAEYLNIPYITICSALLINEESTVPPWIKSWEYNPNWWATLRNELGYFLFNQIRKPIDKVIYQYRQQWNLPVYSKEENYDSKLAILCQQPAEFEFPRKHLPSYFHFTGPYHDNIGRLNIDFPFEKLNGKPLIYASMGTLQNRLQYIFEYIAEACVEQNAQLVISLGGSAEPNALPNLPGNPLVVKFAPQLELLKKACLVITHAGLNTTLESLSNGVPMVAIPVTNDQPGVAARIAWTGVGEMLPLKSLSVSKLRTAIQKVLTQDSYKNNAIRLQQAIQQAGGVRRAADIIEQVLSTSKVV